MKNLYIPLLALILTACGGGTMGDVQCNVANACTNTVNVQPGAVQIADLTINAAGGISLPETDTTIPPVIVPTPPAATVPLATVFSTPPLADDVGSIRWTSGGTTYMLRVAELGDVAFIAIYMSPAIPATTWSVSRIIISDLDLNPPISNSDADIRNYISVKVIPALNKWLTENPSVTANQFTLMPVSTLSIPAEWSIYRRLAASIPQSIKWTGTVVSLK